MKGVLMKLGQLVSFIAEGLPDEAQAALATLQADAAPMSPTLAAGVVRDELGAEPEDVFARWEDLPGRRGQHRPGPPGHDARGPTGRRQGAVPGRRRGDRGGPRRRRGDVQRVLGAGAQRARRPWVSSTSCGPGCARSSTTGSRPATSPSSPRHFAGHPWVRIPRAPARAVDRAGADHRVDRRHVVGPVRGHGVARDQAARRRGDLALRSALDPAPRRVQRRPAPRQLPLPPRRQRDVPRLRPRQALGATASGSGSSRASTPSSCTATPSGSSAPWRRPGSSPTGTASTR